MQSPTRVRRRWTAIVPALLIAPLPLVAASPEWLAAGKEAMVAADSVYASRAGLEILQAIALVDRSNGLAAQRFSELGIPHVSLVTPTDLGVEE